MISERRGSRVWRVKLRASKESIQAEQPGPGSASHEILSWVDRGPLSALRLNAQLGEEHTVKQGPRPGESTPSKSLKGFLSKGPAK